MYACLPSHRMLGILDALDEIAMKNITDYFTIVEHVICYEIFGCHLTGIKNFCGVSYEDIDDNYKELHKLPYNEKMMVHHIMFNRMSTYDTDKLGLYQTLVNNRVSDRFEYMHPPGFDYVSFITTYHSYMNHRYPVPSCALDEKMATASEISTKMEAILLKDPQNMQKKYPMTYESLRRRIPVRYTTMKMAIIHMSIMYYPYSHRWFYEDSELGDVDNTILAKMLYPKIMKPNGELPTNIYQFIADNQAEYLQYRNEIMVSLRHHIHTDLFDDKWKIKRLIEDCGDENIEDI